MSKKKAYRSKKDNIMIMKKYLCFLFLLMLCSITHAATPSTEGTEFWVTFMNNQNIPASNDSLQLKLIVSSRESATVTMRNPQTGWSASLMVGANQVAEYVLPNSEVYTYSAGRVEKKGLVVTSTAPMSLYAANFKEHTYDATIVMPTTALGTDYVVQMYEADMSSKEISVVATADNTQVTITPHARTTLGQVKGVSFTITLQRGESYMLMSNDSGNDFSGTRIQSDKPVAVFAGHSCLYVPVDNPTCDHIVEQQLPTLMWGKQFAVTKTKEHNGDRVMITARNNNTKVYVNGNLQTTLNELESYEFRLIDNSAYIETTEPTACYLYVEGAKDNNMVGDPSSVHISPIEQKIKRLTFATFQTDVSRTHYVNVVTTEAGARAMKLDGVSIADQFSPVEGNNALRFAQIHIQHGIHTLETNNDGFTGYVYGVGWCESYAYTIGSATVPLDGQIVVDGESHSDVEYDETRCYKKSIRFEPHANVEFNTIEWSFGDGTTSTQKVVNHTYTAPGAYRIRMIITNEDGRDTAYTNLTLIEQLRDTLYADICKGDVYKFANRTYSTTGKYDVKFTSSGGCDSIVTLCLTVHDTYLVTTNATFPIGSSYRWRGKWYREEGTYYDTLTTVAGCDSILELKLTKTDPTEIMYDTICWQPTYEFKGHTFNIPSYKGFENEDYIDYVLEYRDKEACISYKMNLAIVPMEDGNSIVVYDTIQRGGVYEWMGDKYTEKGTYYKTVYQACECAIDYMLHLEVLPFPITKHYAELCHGDTYMFQNKEYTEPGVYYDTIWTLTSVDAIYEIKIVDARKRTEFSVSNVSSYTFNGKTYTESGTYVDTLQSVGGCDSIVTLNLTVLQNTDCIEAVDLGLSVMWATCNVGASSPEDYGDYFAWGETQPKENYDWTTYKYCKGTNKAMTKYCTNSGYGYNGFTDNKTILDPEDDAATVNWGGAWRMPTDEEMTELREQCKWTWTTQNEVNGYKVVGPNGNSIFLPAAGYMDYSSLNSAGSYANYWSSSLRSSCPLHAFSVYFSSSFVYGFYYNRDHGQSVRPVCSKEQAPVQTYEFVDKDTICGNELPYIWRGKECNVAGVYYDSLKTALGGDSVYVLELAVLPENECNGQSDCIEAVDLGLSVMWATCNVGAEYPEDYGDYFAWGETQPKEQYYWTTYKYCNGSFLKMIKYCTDSSYGNNGFTDNKTVLDSEDDVATVNWGGSWRMPTDEEFTELREKCKWTWSTQSGVNGYIVKGPNGNTIFLPAAGYIGMSGLGDAGLSGYYWSSSLNASVSYNAYSVYFRLSNVRSHDGHRDCGLSVRPICPKEFIPTYEFVDKDTICGDELPYIWREKEYNASGVYYDSLKTALGGDSIYVLELMVLPENECGESSDCECVLVCEGAVDLGLSVNWAPFNIGATKPEEYGDYFAWGEVTPKENYDWTTYLYGKGTNKTFTKYCDDSSYGYNGFVDNKTILDSGDDAAVVNWGGSWRIPTEAEFMELFTQCIWTWTTQNGVKGYRVKGLNGNSIFLPAVGYKDKNSFEYVGSAGYYWLISLGAGYPDKADSFFLTATNRGKGGYDRYYGQAIRPVCPKTEKPEVVVENVTICYGEKYNWNGVEYDLTGIYVDTLKNISCCDSIVKLNLIVLPQIEPSIENVVICEGESYKWNSKEYSVAGEYVDTLRSVQGCDSIVILNLTVLQKNECEEASDCIEAVDLGLSVKWATCNVGAEYPEDYGDYFAWGETEPKTTYSWSTYKYCKGTSKTMTKYCSNSSYGYNGFTDNKIVLEPEDDAAMVNWGGAWRMPTDEEMTELREQCTWTWTTQNGVNGYKVVGKNGNFIFLPAAGYMSTSSLYSVGSYGYYLSSSLDASRPLYACDAYFYSSHVRRSYGNRYYGQSVRPVSSEEQEPIQSYEFVDKDTTCGNELPYIWRGKECNVAGVYYDSLKTAIGGDSVYVLELIVLPEVVGYEESATICYGETYMWRGVEYSEAGVYKDTLLSYFGCDSVVTLNLTIKSICECLSGCDGAVDLGLSVDWAPFNIGATKPEELGYYLAWGETAPQQQNYSWKSYKYCAGTNTTMTKYCTNGSYGTVDNKTILDPEDDAAIANLGGSWRMPTKEEYAELISQCTWTWTTINGVNGCKVTGKNGNSIFLPAAGCMNSGGPYDVGRSGYYYSSTLRSDQPYNAYDVDVTSSGGRMGVGTRNYGQSMRAVCSKNNENKAVIDNVTICYGEKYNWNGVEYSIVGEYLDTLKSVHGCDSIVMLKLTILPEIEPIVSNATICEGESYMWNGKEYSVAGEYVDTLQSTQGCDSIVMFNLTVKSICECLSGCDGAVDLGLSVKWATRNVGAEYPEDYGDYFAWGEIEPKQKYSWETYKYSKGSSSTLTKYCSDNGNNGFIDNKTVLESEDDAATMNWGASWRMPTDAEMTELRTRCTWIWTTQGGVNGYKVVGPNGNFIFLPAAGVFIEDNLDYVKLDGNYWSSSLSLFSSTSSPHANCFTFNYDNVTRYGDPRCVGKSIRPVCSKISESEDVIYNIIICYGENYKWNGKEYSTSGVYKDTLQTDKGCDSIVTLNLTVLPEVVGTEESVTICYGESYKWNSKECSKSGVYVDTLQSAQGCDSIVTLILKVLPKVVGKEEIVTICYGETYKWNSKECSKSGVYVDTLQSAQGCDSIVTLILRVLPEVVGTEENATICYGESYIWRGVDYSVSGVYKDTLQTDKGCDSIVALNLTVLPEVVGKEESATICYGESYRWQGVEYSEAGVYRDTLQTDKGCDSVLTLNLTVLPEVVGTEESATICYGGSYTWQGEEYFATGVYKDTLQSAQGCDSIVTLNLTVLLEVVGKEEIATVCYGGSYKWGGVDYSVSGVYSDTLQSAQGCDSIVTLNLTVLPSYIFADTITILEGDSYSWRGDTYEEAGIYYDSLLTIDGCDSVYTLTLIVEEAVVEDVVVDEINIAEQCAGTGVMDVEVTLTSGVVDEVSFEFSQVGKDAGLENTTLSYSNQMQVQYTNVRAGKYKLKLIGLCNGTKVFEEEKDLTFLYPSTVLMQKWNDVVAVLTHDYNGGYNFVDFKWYKNGVVLSGETRSYIHQPLEIGAEYSALLTEDNGMQLMTCPLIAINNVDISLYPTLLNSGQRVKCNVSEFAIIYIYDMMGNLVSECNVQSGETEIEMPYAAGVYMAKIVTETNKESNIKLIVR